MLAIFYIYICIYIGTIPERKTRYPVSLERLKTPGLSLGKIFHSFFFGWVGFEIRFETDDGGVTRSGVAFEDMFCCRWRDLDVRCLSEPQRRSIFYQWARSPGVQSQLQFYITLMPPARKCVKAKFCLKFFKEYHFEAYHSFML